MTTERHWPKSHLQTQIHTRASDACATRCIKQRLPSQTASTHSLASTFRPHQANSFADYKPTQACIHLQGPLHNNATATSLLNKHTHACTRSHTHHTILLADCKHTQACIHPQAPPKMCPPLMLHLHHWHPTNTKHTTTTLPATSKSRTALVTSFFVSSPASYEACW